MLVTGQTRDAPESRVTYHHGNLRAALVDAGLELARSGGSQAVVLREATRRVGVTANAAYRHFANREALIDGVAGAALARVAADMLRRLDAITVIDPGERALARLRAVGEGYIAFALAEPGWFDVAFFAVSAMDAPTPPLVDDRPAPSPFALLNDVLDELVAAGVVAPEQRPGAEVFCWSAVHGYAALATKGPFRDADDATVRLLADRVVELSIRGVGRRR